MEDSGSEFSLRRRRIDGKELNIEIIPRGVTVNLSGKYE